MYIHIHICTHTHTIYIYTYMYQKVSASAESERLRQHTSASASPTYAKLTLLRTSERAPNIREPNIRAQASPTYAKPTCTVSASADIRETERKREHRTTFINIYHTFRIAVTQQHKYAVLDVLDVKKLRLRLRLRSLRRGTVSGCSTRQSYISRFWSMLVQYRIKTSCSK
jgi:hypothetical protein